MLDANTTVTPHYFTDMLFTQILTETPGYRHHSVKKTENSLTVPQHDKHKYDRAIPLPDMYPGEIKTHIRTRACIKMITATLSTIVKKVETTPIPSTDEWISKM